MGIYDVNLADGDLFSPQQRDYDRQHQQLGKKFVKDHRSKRMVAVTKAKDRALSQPRGTGMTGKTSLPMTEAERGTILMLHGQGLTASQIADRVCRTAKKVQGVIDEVRVESTKVGLDWKVVMKDDAVVAVTDALRCKDDIYKRGVLGKDVLKGLGHFEGDVALNLDQVINTIPPHMRDRYMELGDDPNVIDTSVKEIPDGETR